MFKTTHINMYNSDISSIVKYYRVSEDRLSTTKVMFLDFSYDDNSSKDTQDLPSVGIKVYEKELKNETIKRGLMGETSKIFEEILNRYYDMYEKSVFLDKEKGKESPHLTYDVTEGDTRKLTYMCLNGSRFVTAKCRFGPSNVIVVPDVKYENILRQSFPDTEIIVNNTDTHKDKIFLIRVDRQDTTPGLTMFISKNIATGRYMKLTKIMGKMGKHIDDMAFCYILTDIGFHAENFVQCVYLK